MGAGGRRAGRGLKRAPVTAGEVLSREPRFLTPAIGVFYAAIFGTAALAVEQLAAQVEGPWFNVLGVAVVLGAIVATVLLLRTGWRRHREGLDGRAGLWGAGALGAIVLGGLAIYAMVETASFNSVISGADVHLTRPVLESLPRPPGATLLDERPGLAGTESISDDFSTANLASVVPFYQGTLETSGWLEDPSTAGTSEVRFSKDAYVVTIAPEQPTGSGGFAVTVDHLGANLLGSPTASGTASSSP